MIAIYHRFCLRYPIEAWNHGERNQLDHTFAVTTNHIKLTINLSIIIASELLELYVQW